MGETEVTNKLWETVMGYSPAAGQSDNHPVKNVTWIEAIVFCNKLSVLAGRTPVYSLNRSYRAMNSSLDRGGEPEKIYTSGVPEWTYKLPAAVAADAHWTDRTGQSQQVNAGTAITEAFCRQWFGMSLTAVTKRIEKANKAFLFNSGKWGINAEYDGNLDPDHVNQWGDPWNTSNNGETLVWPDNGAPYPRGTGDNGGGYDYTNDPFGFRTRNAAYDPNIPLVENDNSAYDPNNPPYLRHPVIQNNAGWTAFKTGTGLKSEDSDWPVHPADWLNQWVDAPASPPAGIPAIAYNNDSGAVHHYEVEIVSIDRNADGYRLPTHQQWMWAAMGADMSPGKLSTVDGVSGVNAADYIKPFAGYNGSNDVADYVWYNDSTLQGPPQPVRGKKPNELGIYDLSGNVGEWCYDQWAPLWLLSFPTSGPPVYFVPNPMQDDDHYYGDSHKVLKGGSYTSDVAGLAFGYIAQYIRGIGDTAHDQGLRVMRWVQPGE
jgi:formylglycine-generating enzyme required for sulfatase activity